eukprot:evm.model.NODE_16159_length_32649_cov_71.425774.2
MSEQEPRIATEEQENFQPRTTAGAKKQGKKSKGKPVAGTDMESVLQAGKHVVPVTAKDAAVLQSMEARGKSGQGTEVLKNKEEGGLVPKVESVAAKEGEIVTQSQEEYAKLEAAKEVARNEGLYTTRGEKKKKKKKEQQQRPSTGGQEDVIEIWPDKKDVVQLISMVERAGTLNGVSLKKGGAVARLQSAADRGESCKVPKKVSDLWVEAKSQRPKDVKTRAEAQMLRMDLGKEKLGGGGNTTSSGGGGGSTATKKATPKLVWTCDKLTVDVPMSPVVQPQQPQQMERGASEGEWEEEG